MADDDNYNFYKLPILMLIPLGCQVLSRSQVVSPGPPSFGPGELSKVIGKGNLDEFYRVDCNTDVMWRPLALFLDS